MLDLLQDGEYWCERTIEIDTTRPITIDFEYRAARNMQHGLATAVSGMMA